MEHWKGWDLCAQAHILAWRQEQRAHPTPAQKVQESQTVSEEMVEGALAAYYGEGAPHFDQHQRDDMRAALTAALEQTP